MKYPEFKGLLTETAESRHLEVVAWGAAQAAIKLAHGRHNDVIPQPFVAVLASLPSAAEYDYRVLAVSQLEGGYPILTAEAQQVLPPEAAQDLELQTLFVPEDVVVGGLRLQYYANPKPSQLFINGEPTLAEYFYAEYLPALEAENAAQQRN